MCSAAQVFSQIKSQLFHFNKRKQFYRKCFCTAVINVLYMLQIVCKKRQEELALTDRSHGPHTVLVFFKGINKYLKRNPHYIVYMDFQTLQTKGQKNFAFICKKIVLSSKQKEGPFVKVLNKKAKAEINYKVAQRRSLAVKSQRKISWTCVAAVHIYIDTYIYDLKIRSNTKTSVLNVS